MPMRMMIVRINRTIRGSNYIAEKRKGYYLDIITKY